MQAGRNFDPNTPLADLKVLLGAKMEGRDKIPETVKTSDPLWVDERKIPKNFDARKKWHKKCPRIAEVLDQGRCGSCWAISSAQAFTDRYCIATRGKHQMRLSTANVMSCCKSCGNGCKGGLDEQAWAYFHKHGLPSGGSYNTTEGCQPYTIVSPCRHRENISPYENCPYRNGTPACQTSCTNTLYGKRLDEDYRFAKKPYHLPNDEKAIMRDIMAHGPTTTAFEVMNDFFSYKSGVYEPSKDAEFVGGHAVKLIGWGVEKKVPYWLIMNSWNEYWGDHGLVKMRRNHPGIKLEEECWAAVPDTKRGHSHNLDKDYENL
nr:PREDICTED: cathepsin B-like cysteine proteinase 3 [Bemisia tabaci]